MRSPKWCPLKGLWLGAVVLLTAGCGSQLKTVKVEGVVTLDGKALPGATVTFTPLGEGRSASGRTDRDGGFRLTTFRTDDGALPGEYKVIVVMDKEPEERFVGRDLESFTDQEKYEMFMNHSPKGKRAALAAKKKRVSPVPAVYRDAKSTPLKEVVPPAGKVAIALESAFRSATERTPGEPRSAGPAGRALRSRD
jgi:hypothetical protein